MRKPLLEWQTVLDDTEWDREESLEDLLPAETNDAAPASNRSWPRRDRLVTVAVLVTTLLACTVVLWNQAQSGVSAIEAEIRSVVSTENWVRQEGDVAAAASLVDDGADPSWTGAYLREQERAAAVGRVVQLETALHDTMRLRSGLAMVQVTVTDETGESYRETRFYRDGAEGWQRTSPKTEFWGEAHVAETDHFLIRYRTADTQAVTAAGRLDGLYEQLRSDLGLSGDAPALTVEVAPFTLDSLRIVRFEDSRLTVPSPLLMQLHAALDDADVLVRSIMHPLVIQVWDEAGQTTTAASAWHNGARLAWGRVIRGVQIWQAAAGSGESGWWYDDAVGWLYGEAPDLHAGLREPENADYNALCHEQSLWRLSTPAYISVASFCLDMNWEAHLGHMPPTPDTLHRLLAVDEWDPHPLPGNSVLDTWTQSIAAATVVDYFVQTYGRDQLPELIDGLRTHDCWETLIPAVTGVSAEEFEAGWQQFLADQYGHEQRSD